MTAGLLLAIATGGLGAGIVAGSDPDAEVLCHQGQRDRGGGGAHPRQSEEHSEKDGHTARVVGGHDRAQRPCAGRHSDRRGQSLAPAW